MNTKLKNVLHFYIGAVQYRNKYVDCDKWSVWTLMTPGRYARVVEDLSVSAIQICLRPLSSITEEEMKELYTCDIWKNCLKSEISKIEFAPNNFNHIKILYEGMYGSSGWRAGNADLYLNRISTYQFQYLLSRGFDLFGLIPSGQAIDSTTLTNKTKDNA